MKEFNANYVYIPIFLIAIAISFLKESNPSLAGPLTTMGIILFTILWGFLAFINRGSKQKMLLAIAAYVLFMGYYLLTK